MDWYEPYKKQLEAVFTSANGQIAKFPPPLNEIGLEYTLAFNPLVNDDGTDFICTLLPYWMKEAIDLSDEQCEKLVLVNIYGMLYFFIQDDVMDDKDNSKRKLLLALANLFYLNMFNLLQQLFPTNSTFWNYYERYLTTWADSVVNEGEHNFFMSDPILTAGKAGPVKIASTGALLLIGQAERIEATETAVDLALTTLQMLDDWTDWQQDMEDGSYNGLLALIASQMGEGTTFDMVTKAQVETQIYVYGYLNRFVEIAERNHAHLLHLQLSITPLIKYHSDLVESLRGIALKIDDNKRKLLGGGLNYMFSK
ncbi:hypothetical protein I6N90_19550 [Paenibacillus sp. GSMTC-2017]|uniref:hypothetical protein n=1 Tax=Paenibacillus sp. GSMTC-2017 TaxID=2794350 RepID=UPI0018D63DF3|nr:hypothetical protein [Paenibacillus sp. GSMTC-2017]MBH5320000.1 hypothetical protein [Paenibacillus sp. GSMTC-2017]